MQQSDFEKLLADTLAAHGRSPRTQETYTLMLRLFGRYLDQVHIGKTLDAVAPRRRRGLPALPGHGTQGRLLVLQPVHLCPALLLPHVPGQDRLDDRAHAVPEEAARACPRSSSPEEIAAIFEACHNLKHKTLLMTSYSGGLRLGETLGLLPSDIDSSADDDPDRAGQGTQGPLRDAVPDPARRRCAVYWKAFRPVRWLFEGRRPRESRSRPPPRRRSSPPPPAGPGSGRACRFTRCATPSRLTCSKAAPTSA